MGWNERAKEAQVGRWCILRTAGPSTLRLVETLNTAGIEAWTPTGLQRWRKPRSKEVVERTVPVILTFVFARASHLPDLVTLSAATVKAQPAFTVFRYYGLAALISDRDLQALRDEEGRLARIVERDRRRNLAGRRAQPYVRGTTVKLPGRSWTGMTGTVEDSDGRHTLVLVGGRVPLKIATSLLREDGAEVKQLSGTAAIAASAS